MFETKLKSLLAAVLLMTLTLTLTDADATSALSSSVGSGTEKPTSSTARSIGNVSLIESERPVANINSGTLSSARALYRNLQQIRYAASRHDAIGVHNGLRQAQRRVVELHAPAALHKLRQQTSLLRRTLKRAGVPLGDEVWLPLRAELERVRMVMPEIDYRAASSAIDRGTAASRQASPIQAQQALGDFEDAVSHNFELLPLGTIEGDLQAAQNASNPAPIYWRGVREAMDSALANIRWVSTQSARGWISAYMIAVDALEALPNQPQAARHDLMRTAASLQGVPTARTYAQRADELAKSQPMTPAAVRQLVDDMAAKMRSLAGF